MIRCRFKTESEDYRPVNWPLKHPYWCTGGAIDFSYSIIVSYADDEDEIRSNWPEAYDLDSEGVEDYVFTSRFPKPEWFI